MSATPLFQAVLGLGILIAGGELLVRGAARTARAVGIPPLVVGLSVLAFGTSAPELAVSVDASLGGSPDVALGNVLGSNAFNILVVLGTSAVITPLVVQRQLLRLDVPVMVGASGLVLVLALDRRIGALDGALLLLLGGLYVAYLAYVGLRAGDRAGHAGRADAQATHFDSRPTPPPVDGQAAHADAQEVQADPQVAQAPADPRTPQADPQTSPPARGLSHRAVDAAFIAAGLAGLAFGSNQLVDGAVTLARAFGISELVIGLTLVAVGTSLPEVVTSVVASVRGERDLAVGNAVGSNIFNLFFVLGAAAVTAKGGVPVSPGALTFDLPVMVAVAVACLPIFLTGRAIHRWEGAGFLFYFGVYMALLFLDASLHPARFLARQAVLEFLLPLTLLTAVLGHGWTRRDRRSGRRS